MTGLHLACSADEAYVPHSAAMLHSVAASVSGPLTVHYLHSADFPDEIAARLEAMLAVTGARAVFHAIPASRLEGLPDPDRFGPAMWYRLFLPELLPEVERLLYLDADTIAVDRLDALWETDLSDVFLAAVRNVFMEFHAYRGEQLGIDLRRYFNSGVLLFNLELMRHESFSERLIELVRREGERLEWPDQDALNLTARDRWRELHPRWNCMNSFFSRPALARQTLGAALVKEAVRDPAIRHFEGPGFNKPWHLMHDRSGQRLYRRHRRATPWPQYELEGRTVRNRLARVGRDLHLVRHPASRVA